MYSNSSPKPYPPNDTLKAFAPFLGEWQTTGTHGMIPNTILHGQTSFALHELGAFIIMRSTIYEDVGIPDGVAIMGSDNILDTYMMVYYDERGVSRQYQVSIEGSVLKWWRDAPEFHQRTTLTMSADEQSMVGKGELCEDGVTWQQDLDLGYSRVKV